MKTRMIVLGLALASTSVIAQGQGRGGPPIPPARAQLLTPEQQEALRKVRDEQRKERLELQEKHRAQIEKILPPEARERMAQRRQQLIREGRAFERIQRGRGMQRMRAQGCVGAGRGGMQPGRGMQMGPGRGMQQGPGRGMQQGPGRGMQQGPGRSMQQGPGRGMQQGPGRGMMVPGRGTQQGGGPIGPGPGQMGADSTRC
jgi:hypothetical protein